MRKRTPKKERTPEEIAQLTTELLSSSHLSMELFAFHLSVHEDTAAKISKAYGLGPNKGKIP